MAGRKPKTPETPVNEAGTNDTGTTASGRRKITTKDPGAQKGHGTKKDPGATKEHANIGQKLGQKIAQKASKRSDSATPASTQSETDESTEQPPDPPQAADAHQDVPVDEPGGESSLIETLVNTLIETLRESTGNAKDALFTSDDAQRSDDDRDTSRDTGRDAGGRDTGGRVDQETRGEPVVVPPIPERTPCVVVVTGNAPLDSDAVARVPDSAIVIAADGGLDFALTSGLRPAALVGDLDSVSAAGLAWAETNASVQRFPADKDRTDTELALAMAADFNPDQLILVAGDGDRMDHTLTALGALGQAVLASVPIVEAWWGDQHLYVVQGPGRASISTTPEMTVSVVATHGPCEGVTLSGVRWPLVRADLAPLSGLGVSNEALGDTVEVAVSSGVLTVFVQPASFHQPVQ